MQSNQEYLWLNKKAYELHTQQKQDEYFRKYALAKVPSDKVNAQALNLTKDSEQKLFSYNFKTRQMSRIYFMGSEKITETSPRYIQLKLFVS